VPGLASRSLSSGAHSRWPGGPQWRGTGCAKNLFIIFVDGIFTTLFERLFTNAFDVIGAKAAFACVVRACNAD
jgi:hypothetical protein